MEKAFNLVEYSYSVGVTGGACRGTPPCSARNECVGERYPFLLTQKRLYTHEARLREYTCPRQGHKAYAQNKAYGRVIIVV